jgi:hypothetical protein
MAKMPTPTEDREYGHSTYYINRGNKTDPRMTNAERLDQRYSNYTYGPSKDYATTQANILQQQGENQKLQTTFLGQQAGANADAAAGRAGPQQTTTANATYDQGRLYNRLLDFADQPAGPSAAQAQLQMGSDRAMAANLALANSGTGMGDSSEAMRRAQFANATQQSETANQSAMLRAQEEQQQRENILQAYGQGAGVLGQQGQLGLAMGDQELASRELNDSTALAYDQLGLQAYGQGADIDLAYEQEARANLENESAANQAYEANATAQDSLRTQRDLQNDQQSHDRDTQLIGAGLGIASSIGGLAMMSDARAKKRIRELDDLNDAYAALSD